MLFANTSRTVAFYAFLFFVFTIPWEDSLVFAGIGTLNRLIGFIAFGLGVLAIIASRKTRRHLSIHGLMLVFVYWVMLSLFWSLDSQRTQIRIITYIQLLGMTLLTWEFATDEIRGRRLMQAYVLGAYVSAIWTIQQYLAVSGIIDEFESPVRYAAKGFDFNELALYLSLGIPFSWYLSLKSQHPIGLWGNRIYIPLATLAVTLTGSRSGFLTFLVAMVFIPFSTLVEERNGIRRLLVFSLILASLWGVKEYVGDLAPAKRIAALNQEFQSGDFSRRSIVWSAGLQVWQDRPLLGAGAGAFHIVVYPLTNITSAHSSYISLLTELGIIGLAFFIIIPTAILASSIRASWLVKMLWVCLFTTLALGSAGLSWEYSKGTWFLFGLGTAHIYYNSGNKGILV